MTLLSDTRNRSKKRFGPVQRVGGLNGRLRIENSMKTIRIKKGYNLKVVGSPSVATQKAQQPTHLALLPERIPFVKPRLKVAKGDRVALGSPLIEDKRNPQIQFLSPGGGHITDIHFGPRRVIQEIIIKLDEIEKAVDFERYPNSISPATMPFFDSVLMF